MLLLGLLIDPLPRGVAAQQTTTPVEAVVVDPELRVYIDGRIASFTDAETRLCGAMSSVACVRLRASSLAAFDQYSIAVVAILPGVPTAETAASAAASTSLLTRPSGVFRIERVEPPPAPTGLSERDKLMYVGAAGFVGGVLLTAIVAYCLRRCARRRSDAERAALASAATVDGAPLLPGTWPSKASLDVAARLEQLEALVQHLSFERDKMQLAGDAADKAAVQAFESASGHADDPDALLDDLIVQTGGKAAAVPAPPKPWWQRDSRSAVEKGHEVTDELIGGSANQRGMLAPGLLRAPLGSRIPPELFTSHWHFRRGFPALAPAVAGLLHVAKSNLHGLGVFAARFISPGVVLFPYLAPEYLSDPSVRRSFQAMALRYGAAWERELNFVAVDLERKMCVDAERPEVRGWGCLLNSARGMADLEANCELVWCGPVPYVRTTAHIPPLAELLLDYPFPAAGASSNYYHNSNT